MDHWVFTLFAFLFGSLIGSFLNVVIYRLPLGQSVVRPKSHCPRCKNPIRPYHNIPILGWLILRGKCADCALPIPVRYPAVELMTAMLTAAVWVRFGPTLAGAAYWLFTVSLVAITFIDIDHQIIPDRFSLGGIVLGLAISPWMELGWKGSLLGFAAGSGSLLAVAIGYKLITKVDGMGMGDVKLLGAIGAFLGWRGVLFTIFAGSLTGSIVGIAAIQIQKSERGQPIPFGPFLALGALVYLFAGPTLISAYLDLFH